MPLSDLAHWIERANDAHPNPDGFRFQREDGEEEKFPQVDNPHRPIQLQSMPSSFTYTISGSWPGDHTVSLSYIILKQEMSTGSWTSAIPSHNPRTVVALSVRSGEPTRAALITRHVDSTDGTFSFECAAQA